MSNNQNYQVNYLINVDASKGVEEVDKFAKSVAQLNAARLTFDTAVTNIQKMMNDIDKAFRTKSGKKRDYSFQMAIKTNNSEKNLEKVVALLETIETKSKNIVLNLNPTQPLKSDQIKANAKEALTKSGELAKNFRLSQQGITKSIGKINAGFKTLEKGREINIKTDVAQRKLTEILLLINHIRTGSRAFQLGSLGYMGGRGSGSVPVPTTVIPFRNDVPFVMSDKANEKLQEQLYKRQVFHKQKQGFDAENRVIKEKQNAAKKLESDKLKAQKAQAAFEKKVREAQIKEENQRIKEQKRADLQAQKLREKSEKELRNQQLKEQKERENRQRKNALETIRNTQRQHGIGDTIYGTRRRAAINRLQYSKPFSVRNLPMGYMLNAYMGYNLMKSELTKAVEYSNIMESAHSILKVADGDLGTFEKRFDGMARHVRNIGVETKFTAIEVAGAVKYLSMAGMGIETINESIRPITSLALIGDNDVSQIADLATNIMAGYDIKSTSMVAVADILASSVSRSNVNIIEMAESYKMAAGYMKLAGVEFSESSAAIGILGNMGVKGTMAGTALRAMATRFAKPTKEAQSVMDKFNIKFTQYETIYGKRVEKLRPLAEIFKELNEKGASMADMQALFGKIGGNAAMMFLNNYDKLGELTSQNRASQGISAELAKVKQDTTKGLWFQVTSQFSERFMQGYELLEPQIKSVLRDLLSKFNAKEFTQGLTSIGGALLDILSAFANIANWMVKNFYWIEPMLFSGFVATKLFKLAGALTNVGVALGFIGKQSIASSSLQAIGGLVGMGGNLGNVGKVVAGQNLGKAGLSFANKRALVSSFNAAGISGKGAVSNALVSMGLSGGASSVLTNGAASGVFSSQVAVGNGLLGAGSSIAALGTGAVVATGAITALAGALAYVGYKTWKVKQAKDAMLEELAENRKYRYPSLEALYESLSRSHEIAVATKDAINSVTSGRTLEEASGHKVGALTSNWWKAVISWFTPIESSGFDTYTPTKYTIADAYQDDTRDAILAIADRDAQSRINSAYAKLAEYDTPEGVKAFKKNIQEFYGQSEDSLDKTLWTQLPSGAIVYNKRMGKLAEEQIPKTFHYAKYQNEHTVPQINIAADAYLSGISSYEGAKALLEKVGVDFPTLEEYGFYRDGKGIWQQKLLSANASSEERTDAIANYGKVNKMAVDAISLLRTGFGGSSRIAENIMKAAGFTPTLYSNEPLSNGDPSSSNPITNGWVDEDGKAGGNYSGTGKLSSAAPKQVIVTISNLLSIQTLQLLSSPEGNREEIQNLKEQMAQALIDVVHDFDASWNG